MTPWGLYLGPPWSLSCISSPFQSLDSWKGHQIPQRRQCMKAARDEAVAVSCDVKDKSELEDTVIKLLCWLFICKNIHFSYLPSQHTVKTIIFIVSVVKLVKVVVSALLQPQKMFYIQHIWEPVLWGGHPKHSYFTAACATALIVCLR